MTDAKRAIEVLSNQANYSHCPDPPVPTIKLGYEAGKGIAELIERLTAELDKIKQERDVMKAMVLKITDICSEECSGDYSVGIQGCPFYQPLFDDNGELEYGYTCLVTRMRESIGGDKRD